MLGASETLRFEKRALACLGHVRDATHVHPTSMSTARLRRLRRLASVRLLAVSVARLLAPHGRTPLRSPEAAPGRVRLRLRAVAPGLRTALRGRLPPTQPGMVDPGVSESECLNVDPCMHVRVLQLCVCVCGGGGFSIHGCANPSCVTAILCMHLLTAPSCSCIVCAQDLRPSFRNHGRVSSWELVTAHVPMYCQ